MDNGYFSFPPSNSEKISPTAFGYWSVRWADGLVSNAQSMLTDGDLSRCSTYLNSYLVELQLLALYSSAYSAYVIYLLEVPTECLEEMEAGRNDSIKERKGPNGTEITDEIINIYNSFFQGFSRAIRDDWNNSPNPDVINPDINSVAKYFIEGIEHYYFKGDIEMPEMEKFRVGHFIATIPIDLFQALKSQGLEYTPYYHSFES